MVPKLRHDWASMRWASVFLRCVTLQNYWLLDRFYTPAAWNGEKHGLLSLYVQVGFAQTVLRHHFVCYFVCDAANQRFCHSRQKPGETHPE